MKAPSSLVDVRGRALLAAEISSTLKLSTKPNHKGLESAKPDLQSLFNHKGLESAKPDLQSLFKKPGGADRTAAHRGNASTRLRSVTTQTGCNRHRRDLARAVAPFDDVVSEVLDGEDRPQRAVHRPESPTPARTPTGPRPRRGCARGAQAVIRCSHRLTRVEDRRQPSRHEPQPHQRHRRTPGTPATAPEPTAAQSRTRPEHVRQPGTQRDQPPHQLQPHRAGRAQEPVRPHLLETRRQARAAGTAAGTPSPPASSSAVASIPPSDT